MPGSWQQAGVSLAGAAGSSSSVNLPNQQLLLPLIVHDLIISLLYLLPLQVTM
jgi:hypothetical protein